MSVPPHPTTRTGSRQQTPYVTRQNTTNPESNEGAGGSDRKSPQEDIIDLGDGTKADVGAMLRDRCQQLLLEFGSEHGQGASRATQALETTNPEAAGYLRQLLFISRQVMSLDKPKC